MWAGSAVLSSLGRAESRYVEASPDLTIKNRVWVTEISTVKSSTIFWIAVDDLCSSFGTQILNIKGFFSKNSENKNVASKLNEYSEMKIVRHK